MELKQYGRKDFTVDGVQVTADNMQDVADWCGGSVEEQASKGSTEKFVKVPVHRPLNEKQTKGFIGDWVLQSPTGFKVYTDRAFENSFEERTKHRNVFEQAAEVQAIVDEANTRTDVQDDECGSCGLVKPLIIIDKDRKLCRKCAKKFDLFFEDESTTRDRLGFNAPHNLMEG